MRRLPGPAPLLPPPHAFQSTINVVKSLVKYAKSFQFSSTLGNKNDEVPDDYFKVHQALLAELFPLSLGRRCKYPTRFRIESAELHLSQL